MHTDDKSESRFDAVQVRRIAATKRMGRIELHFSDANDRRLAITLPPELAIELGRLICDLADGTPFLKGKPIAGERKSKS